MKITLYNVISSDGYVAAIDKSEDFIPDELWDSFIEICNQNDVLIWGKNTYERFKDYEQSLIDQFLALPIKKIILTTNKNFAPEHPFEVFHSTKDVLRLDKNILICSSFILNDLFIQEKVVNQVVVNVLPIVLGDGIPQFKSEPHLVLVSEKPKISWIEKVYNIV